MACDTESPWVGNTLTIYEQDVRAGGEGLKYGGQDWGLSEGKESRDVWEGHFRRGHPTLDVFQFWIGQYYDGSRGLAIRPHTRYIQTGHQFWVTVKGTGDYPVGESALDVNGLVRGEVPRVYPSRFHFDNGSKAKIAMP